MLQNRIYSLLLILLLVLPQPLALLYLNFKKEQIKVQVRSDLLSRVSLEKTIKLEFENISIDSKIRFERKDEFEFNGYMYDIVKTIKTKNKTTFYCLLDNKETDIKKKIRSIISNMINNDATNKNNESKLIEIFKNLFFELSNSLIISDHEILGHGNLIFNLIFRYSKTPHSPPELH